MYETPYNECMYETDVREEIAVYPEYIQYNTRCWPCRIDYAKFEYKVEWKKLFVKAFEYAYVEFGKNYEETDPFFFLKEWKFDEKVAEEHKERMIKNMKRIHEEQKKEHKDDPRFQWDFTKEDEDYRTKTAKERSWYAKTIMEWHEFKYVPHTCCSRKARNYIIRKIENKDFD